jgi:hypothetical protein
MLGNEVVLEGPVERIKHCSAGDAFRSMVVGLMGKELKRVR